MSVLIFVITIVGLAFVIWMVRKVLDLMKVRQANGEGEAEVGTPNSTGSSNPGSAAGQAQSSSQANGNPEFSNYKNPDGRRVLNAMLFMAQQYSSRNRSSQTHRKPSPPQTMRRASLHNGTVRVRSTGSPHRVVPSRASYHRRQPGAHGSHSLPPPLQIGENTVQIEVPIVVVLPPGPSTSRTPVTILYNDPPPPFDEEPPPPYDEIFGPHYKHVAK